MAKKLVKTFLVSDIGQSIGNLLGYEPGITVCRQMIVDISTGLKVIYSDLVGYLLWAKISVRTTGYCSKFLPLPSLGRALIIPRELRLLCLSLGHDLLSLDRVGIVFSAATKK